MVKAGIEKIVESGGLITKLVLAVLSPSCNSDGFILNIIATFVALASARLIDVQTSSLVLMIVQGAALQLSGAVTAKQAIYKVSCILECGQSLMHLSVSENRGVTFRHQSDS